MQDVFCKFIIGDGRLTMGKVTYHRELITDEKEMQGGGWFEINNEEKKIVFFGSSDQFGAATIKDIRKCIEQKRVFIGLYEARNASDTYEFYYRVGTELINLKREQ